MAQRKAAILDPLPPDILLPLNLLGELRALLPLLDRPLRNTDAIADLLIRQLVFGDQDGRLDLASRERLLFLLRRR